MRESSYHRDQILLVGELKREVNSILREFKRFISKGRSMVSLGNKSIRPISRLKDIKFLINFIKKGGI